MNTQPIAILLVDAHPVVRAGFRRLLEGVSGQQIIGEVASDEEALRFCAGQPPDVVLIDLSMSVPARLMTVRRLRKQLPGLPVLAFNLHDNEMMFSQAMQAGVSGYLNQHISAATLQEAISAVARGKAYIAPELLGRALSGEQAGALETLTPRELEVFTLLAEGGNIKEIAATLSISPKTAGVHQTRIMHKLGLRNAVQLVRLALRQGLISP